MSYKKDFERIQTELFNSGKTLEADEEFSMLHRMYDIVKNWADSLHNDFDFTEIDNLLNGGAANIGKLKSKLIEISSNLRDFENQMNFDEANDAARNNQLGRNQYTPENPYHG